MRKSMLLVCSLLLVAASLSFALPAKGRAKRDLFKHWKKYPGEKLISAKAFGSISKKRVRVRGRARLELGYAFKLKIRKKGRKRVFNTTVWYLCNRSGRACRFKEISVGRSTVSAKKGEEAPSYALVIRILKSTAHKTYIRGLSKPFRFDKIKLREAPEFKSFGKNRFGYLYTFDFSAFDKQGKKKNCRSLRMVLSKEKGSKDWASSYQTYATRCR